MCGKRESICAKGEMPWVIKSRTAGIVWGTHEWHSVQVDDDYRNDMSESGRGTVSKGGRQGNSLRDTRDVQHHVSSQFWKWYGICPSIFILIGYGIDTIDIIDTIESSWGTFPGRYYRVLATHESRSMYVFLVNYYLTLCSFLLFIEHLRDAIAEIRAEHVLKLSIDLSVYRIPKSLTTVTNGILSVHPVSSIMNILFTFYMWVSNSFFRNYRTQ